jgi:NADH-quinone oxidoreductase subunit H
MTSSIQSYLGIGWGWFVANLIYILLIALPLMLAVAMIIYADRKIWAAMALRRGPNVVGPFGLLQSFADGLKVFLQETIIPSAANKGLFLLAPIITFTVALMAWAVVPFGAGMVLANINVGLLYILAISSLGVYGVIISGWASNSKYPFFSAMRASAQMISYEVSIGFVLISVVLWSGSFNLSTIVETQKGYYGFLNGHGFNPLLFPMAVVFLISAMAETARAPFDLTEAESELVAGYQTEYSSMAFALFWLGEYANVILMCALNAILFWGGYLPPVDWAPLYLVPGIIWLFIKILVFFFIFSWVKATVPRYRYDQLMRLGWKIFLPLSLFFVFLVSGFLMLTRYDGVAKVAAARVSDVCRLVKASDYASDGKAAVTPVYLYRPRGGEVRSDQLEIVAPQNLAGRYRFVMDTTNGYGGSGLLQPLGKAGDATLRLGVTDVVRSDHRANAILVADFGNHGLVGDCEAKSELDA